MLQPRDVCPSSVAAVVTAMSVLSSGGRSHLALDAVQLGGAEAQGGGRADQSVSGATEPAPGPGAGDAGRRRPFEVAPQDAEPGAPVLVRRLVLRPRPLQPLGRAA